MKRFALICSVVVLALFCTSLRVTARTIAYEGCDYAVTNNVSGLNGGSGWQAGWTWNWASGTKWWQVVEPGLTYADGTTNLAVKGRAFRGSYNGYDQCTRMPSQAEFGHLTDNGFLAKRARRTGSHFW